ncbi:hypothetical protein GCM10011365_15200 [Marinicella pacifica]|uniref:Protein kinase domain-containing protein n=1 Tax=Marinicella pacifica TaxID=1171543 RepID=A0A917CPH6_9GAMM|nr:serine/threonine-protein kinase [Marinicella pacifica]GGF94830.1 hypothetical protein GCM10011365_15200 [Marinicella pacifica]
MSGTDFHLINEWFEKLMDLSVEAQQHELENIKQSSALTIEQFELLANMLQADNTNDLPENIQNMTVDWHRQDASLQMESMPKLGNYRLIKPLGTGGMGHVYLAERADGSYQKQVAIKISQFQVKASMIKRFENERQILAKLNHPHIAQLLDGGAAQDGRPYLVMEYVPGKDIATYCIEKKLGLRARLGLVLQICEAVSYAHQQLILHRDLKPNNILVNEQNQVKLLDFGIGKLLDEEQSHAQTATQIMTRSYASPEQIKGEHVSTASDLFSLAVVTYELLTGYHPYPCQSGLERDQNVVSGKIRKFTNDSDNTNAIYPKLSTIANERLRGDVETILHKALAPSPKERYVSVETFAEDIKNYLHNRTIMARKPTPWYTFRKMVQRHRAVFSVAAVAFVMLFLTTVYALNLANEAETQRQLAIKESAESKQVTQLLTNVFLKANPEGRKVEVTAKDLLLQGFDEVKNGLKDMPEQRFELMNTLLHSMFSLGYFDTILATFEQAYPNCVDELGAEHESCQSMLIRTSTTATRLQNDEEAVELLALALKNLSEQGSELHLRIVQSQFNSLMNLKRSSEARNAAESALALMDQLNKPMHHKVDIYSDLAVYFTHQSDFETAQVYFDKCASYLASEGKDNHSFRSIYHANYGFFFTKQQRYDEAVRQRQLALEVSLSESAMPTLGLAFDLEALGQTQYLAGDLAAAIDSVQQAIETYHQLDSETDQALYNLHLFLVEWYFLNNQTGLAQQVMNNINSKHASDNRCRFELGQALTRLFHQNGDEAVSNFLSCIKNINYRPYPQIYQHLLPMLQDIEQEKNRKWLQQFWQQEPKTALTLKHYFEKTNNFLTQ